MCLYFVLFSCFLYFFFFFNDTATTEIYTLSLHDALPLWGVAAAFDPMRSTREGEMTVAVDHPGDDRGAACVDHLSVAGILLRVAWTDPRDATLVHEHAHAKLERRRAPVGKCRIAIQRAQALPSGRDCSIPRPTAPILAPARCGEGRQRPRLHRRHILVRVRLDRKST